MPDDKPHTADGPVTPQPITPKPPKPETPTTDYAHVPMGEEFSSAKWKLPPAGVVLVALAIVAVIVAIVVFALRPKPGAAGTIDDLGAVATDPNDTMVALQITLSNITDRPFWIKAVTSKLQVDNQEYSDTAASAVDFERYFQAFPDLKQHAAAEPLKPEIRIPPGGVVHGSLIFSFPVSKDTFDKRKSLSVSVEPYDQPKPVVITK